MTEFTHQTFYDTDTFARFLRFWNLHTCGAFIRSNPAVPEAPNVGWYRFIDEKRISAWFRADIVPSLLTK